MGDSVGSQLLLVREVRLARDDGAGRARHQPAGLLGHELAEELQCFVGQIGLLQRLLDGGLPWRLPVLASPARNCQRRSPSSATRRKSSSRSSDTITAPVTDLSTTPTFIAALRPPLTWRGTA